MKIIEFHLLRKQLFSWLCLNYMFVSLNVKTRTRKYVSNLFSSRHMIKRPPARMRGKLGSPWSHKSTHFINSTCNFHNEREMSWTYLSTKQIKMFLKKTQHISSLLCIYRINSYLKIMIYNIQKNDKMYAFHKLF